MGRNETIFLFLMTMISTVLPNINDHGKSQPKLDRNVVVFAETGGQYFYPEHKTPYLLVSNFVNKGKYAINKKQIEVSDKHFYLLNADDDLEIRFLKAVPLKTLLILFEDEFIKGCFSYAASSTEQLLEQPSKVLNAGPELPNVPFAFNKNIQKITSQVVQSARSQAAVDELLFELMMNFVVLNKETSKQIKRVDAVKKSTREELYRRLFLAKEFMHDNAFENLTVSQVAGEVCLDKFHFLRNFKNVFHTTPHQYLTEIKLQQAHQLLKSQGVSVTDACYIIGFDSVGSFSNLFKKRFGMSPSTIAREE